MEVRWKFVIYLKEGNHQNEYANFMCNERGNVSVKGDGSEFTVKKVDMFWL